MQTITLDEAKAALDVEFFIVSSIDSKVKKKKHLTFNPARNIYRVRLCGRNTETSNSYDNLGNAVEKYNSYLV